MTLTDEQILKDRETQYGDSNEGLYNLGMKWTALLQNYFGVRLPHLIPADIVCLMLADLKSIRASKQKKCNPDHYADGRNYFTLAEKAKKWQEDSQ